MMAELVRRSAPTNSAPTSCPRFARGELRGGLALTEPDCGTDLQAIRMTARRDGDGYVVNGTKTWITNGIDGNCLAVLAKTDFDARHGHRGMSLFLVAKDPTATRCTRKLGKLGYKGVDTVELLFDDVPSYRREPARRRRGPRIPAGGRRARARPHQRRGARGRASRDAALQASLRYAQQRHTMGKPIGEHQAIQLKLADMALPGRGRPPAHRARGARLRRGRALRHRSRDGEARSPPKPRSRTPPRRCASTAPTATPPRSTSSGTTATLRCCASARARTRSSAS